MKISDLVDGVVLDADGCSHVNAVQALRRAAREFCIISEVWSYEASGIYTSANQSVYNVDVPIGAVPVRVLGATQGGRHISIVTPQDMSSAIPDWREDESDSGEALALIYYTEDNSVEVYPKPTGASANPINIKLVLQPSLTASTIPDGFDRWAETLQHGALAYLKAMSGKSWSAPVEAIMHQREFRRLTAQARIAKEKGYGEGRPVVNTQRFV